MSKRRQQPPRDQRRIGLFDNISMQVKLISRLMADRRVNPLLKLLPIGAMIYLIIPDTLIGPIDDAAIIWIGTSLFVELCPPEIVREHREALASVIDGEWRVVDDDDTPKFDSSDQKS
jgi:uncharacterized membrane protein YkvA (DUF1232 family)